MTADAIAGGAVGVDMGRNIFQSDSPVGMIKAVRAVVHENATVDEAFDLYREELAAERRHPGAGGRRAGRRPQDLARAVRVAVYHSNADIRLESGRCRRSGRPRSSFASGPPASVAPTSWSGTACPTRPWCWATRSPVTS